MARHLMSLREVEQATLLSRSTLYRRLREGRLLGVKLDNGSWRVPLGEVEKILAGPPQDAG